MNSESPLLISLRPRFAEMVFLGKKHVELRRRFTPYAEGRDVFVYVSRPEKIVRGGFRLSEVWSDTPKNIWDKVSSKVGVAWTEFEAYCSGSEIAFALSISDAWEFRSPISLDELKGELGCFTTPQSWRYLNDRETRFLGERVPTDKRCGLSEVIS